jgi:hypothetical protein
MRVPIGEDFKMDRGVGFPISDPDTYRCTFHQHDVRNGRDQADILGAFLASASIDE